MKLIVDRIFRNCEQCNYHCTQNNYVCCLTEKGWVDETPESMSCPLFLESEHDKQLRTEILNKIKKIAERLSYNSFSVGIVIDYKDLISELEELEDIVL